MTLRMAFIAGFMTCLLVTLLLRKRRTALPAQPVDSDRFNMAGLDDRMKQYDREFRLEGRKHE